MVNLYHSLAFISLTSARPSGATTATTLVTPVVVLTTWRFLMFRSLMHKITNTLANEKR
jgi:hypothetical protein